MDRVITDINQLDFNKRYTYSDYLSWQFEDMVELIRGKIFRMSPAPSRKHQQVAGRLHGELYHAFSDHLCELYIAPFDVKLPLSTQDDPILHNSVVQPDICVVHPYESTVLIYFLNREGIYESASLRPRIWGRFAKHPHES